MQDDKTMKPLLSSIAIALLLVPGRIAAQADPASRAAELAAPAQQPGDAAPKGDPAAATPAAATPAAATLAPADATQPAARPVTQPAAQPAAQPAVQGRSAAAAGTAPGGGSVDDAVIVQHVPLHQMQSGTATFVFTVVNPQRIAELVLRYRLLGDDGGAGDPKVHERVARRGDGGYVVTIPGKSVQPPGFDYWAVARDHAGGEQAVFASAQEAQRVTVVHSAGQQHEQEALDRRGGHRSSAFASAEWVDFGDRSLFAGADKTHDRYYRVEAGYAYHILSTVDDIRLGVVRVRGQASETINDGTATSEFDPGIDYGQATVGLHLMEEIRLRGSLLLGASQDGFESGVGAAIVFGSPERNHLLAGVESLSTLGVTATMQMAFMATTWLPMGAAIQVTDFPVGDGHGVRLLYDVGYRFAPASEVIIRAGYQGRSSVTGGPSVGLRTRFAF